MALSGKQVAFLAAFCEVGHVGKAAGCIEVTRQTVWIWKRDSAEFLRHFEQARLLAVEKLEDVAHDMAFEGDAKLLMFLLRHLKPEVYKDKLVLDFSTLNDDQIRSLVGSDPDGSGSAGDHLGSSSVASALPEGLPEVGVPLPD